jgi:hypothetical protein
MRRVTGSERSARLSEKFPYVVAQQGRLRRDFHFNVSSCGNVINTQNPETNPTDRNPEPTAGPTLAGAGPSPSPSVSPGSNPSLDSNSPTFSSPSPTVSDPGKGNNGKGNGGNDGSPNGRSDSSR